MNRCIWILLILLSVTGTIVVIIFLLREIGQIGFHIMYGDSIAMMTQVNIGMTEQQVIKVMGREPDLIVSTLNQLQKQLGVGYALPKRPIRNKALVYFTTEAAIILIYINKQGRVEWIYIGGS